MAVLLLISPFLAAQQQPGEVVVTFKNRTPNAVELYWIGADGSPVSYGEIPAGEDKVQRMNAGHIWNAVQGEKVLKEFTAGSGPRQEVEIKQGFFGRLSTRISDKIKALKGKGVDPRRRPDPPQRGAPPDDRFAPPVGPGPQPTDPSRRQPQLVAVTFSNPSRSQLLLYVADPAGGDPIPQGVIEAQSRLRVDSYPGNEWLIAMQFPQRVREIGTYLASAEPNQVFAIPESAILEARRPNQPTANQSAVSVTFTNSMSQIVDVFVVTNPDPNVAPEAAGQLEPRTSATLSAYPGTQWVFGMAGAQVSSFVTSAEPQQRFDITSSVAPVVAPVAPVVPGTADMVNVTFENKTATTAYLYVQNNNSADYMGELPAGGTVPRDSYPGNVWLFGDKDGIPLEVSYTATAQARQSFVLEAQQTPVAPDPDPLSVTFRNKTAQKVRLYSTNEVGAPAYVAEIPAGGSSTQKTHDKARWIFGDEQGEAIAGYDATSAAQQSYDLTITERQDEPERAVTIQTTGTEPAFPLSRYKGTPATAPVDPTGVWTTSAINFTRNVQVKNLGPAETVASMIANVAKLPPEKQGKSFDKPNLPHRAAYIITRVEDGVYQLSESNGLSNANRLTYITRTAGNPNVYYIFARTDLTNEDNKQEWTENNASSRRFIFTAPDTMMDNFGIDIWAEARKSTVRLPRAAPAPDVVNVTGTWMYGEEGESYKVPHARSAHTIKNATKMAETAGMDSQEVFLQSPEASTTQISALIGSEERILRMQFEAGSSIIYQQLEGHPNVFFRLFGHRQDGTGDPTGGSAVVPYLGREDYRGEEMAQWLILTGPQSAVLENGGAARLSNALGRYSPTVPMTLKNRLRFNPEGLWGPKDSTGETIAVSWDSAGGLMTTFNTSKKFWRFRIVPGGYEATGSYDALGNPLGVVPPADRRLILNTDGTLKLGAKVFARVTDTNEPPAPPVPPMEWEGPWKSTDGTMELTISAGHDYPLLLEFKKGSPLGERNLWSLVRVDGPPETLKAKNVLLRQDQTITSRAFSSVEVVAAIPDDIGIFQSTGRNDITISVPLASGNTVVSFTRSFGTGINQTVALIDDPAYNAWKGIKQPSVINRIQEQPNTYGSAPRSNTQALEDAMCGYHIQRMNPNCLVERGTSGGNARIFQHLDFNSKYYTLADSGAIPPVFLYGKDGTAGGGNTTTMYFSQKERSKGYTVSVSADSGSVGGSGGYSEAATNLDSTNSVSIINMKWKASYFLSLNKSEVKLERQFIDAVMALQPGDFAGYGQFFETWGTHYPLSTLYGAKLIGETIMSAQKAAENFSSNWNVGVTLTKSGGGNPGGSGGVQYAKTSSAASAVETSDSKTWYFGVGGTVTGETVITSDSEAKPIKVRLQPIWELVLPRLFEVQRGDDAKAADITRRREEMKTMLEAHLNLVRPPADLQRAPRVFRCVCEGISIVDGAEWGTNAYNYADLYTSDRNGVAMYLFRNGTWLRTESLIKCTSVIGWYGDPLGKDLRIEYAVVPDLIQDASGTVTGVDYHLDQYQFSISGSLWDADTRGDLFDLDPDDRLGIENNGRSIDWAINVYKRTPSFDLTYSGDGTFGNVNVKYRIEEVHYDKAAASVLPEMPAFPTFVGQ
ncbi:MAG: hypothetical protein JNJ83_18320 [Verrucomicrobiaceae bacterium]|nr:hypothetical protein [Verrucomicrobiaceae bacterium]